LTKELISELKIEMLSDEELAEKVIKFADCKLPVCTACDNMKKCATQRYTRLYKKKLKTLGILRYSDDDRRHGK
jgi:hypothetical protein